MNMKEIIDAAKNTLRFRQMALSTEKIYLYWIRVFGRWCITHNNGDHTEKVRGFLTHLAREKNVSPSTQNQALNALVFLYKHVLKTDAGDFSAFERAKKPRRLPVVLSQQETTSLLSHITGQNWLITSLLYGAGLRLNEALSLRTKDIDFDRSIPEVSGEQDRLHLALAHTQQVALVGARPLEPSRCRT